MPATNPRFLPRFAVVAGATSGLRQVNQRFLFDEGGGELIATITAGNYYVREDGGFWASGGLLTAIAAAMNAVGANTYAASVSTTGRVTIARTAGAAAFTLRWASATTPRFDGTFLGFDTSANDGPGTTFTSDYQHRFGWFPEQPMLDGYRYFPTATVGSARSMGDIGAHAQYTQRWDRDRKGEARIDYVRYTKVRYDDIDGTVWGSLYQPLTSGFATLWEGFYELARDGVPFEIHPNVAINDGIEVYIDPEAQAWREGMEGAVELLMERGERYRVTVPWRPTT